MLQRLNVTIAMQCKAIRRLMIYVNLEIVLGRNVAHLM